MSAAEQRAFLAAERVAICTTIGPRGWPHSMPLWYVPVEGAPEGGEIVRAWTFAKSQKVRNLERDPRATLLVEAGDAYAELRGVQIEAGVEIVREPERVVRFAHALADRYREQIAGVDVDAGEMLAAQAPKRVVLGFHPRRAASWDHRKLGGGY